jgi:hypothetical protein
MRHTAFFSLQIPVMVGATKEDGGIFMNYFMYDEDRFEEVDSSFDVTGPQVKKPFVLKQVNI